MTPNAILQAAGTDRTVLIAGPTASGKSALALEIAAKLGGVVVNADALQVFANWQVLTARPSHDDMAGIPHALYGHVPGDAHYSVGHWLRDVAPFLTGTERPIIVGGTGLNLSALTQGLADIPPTPPEIRAQANTLMDTQGPEALLCALDPVTAARIDQNNPVRIQRAWEVQKTTGRGLASWQDETGPPLVPFQTALPLVLRPDPAWLNASIERRFEEMLKHGAVEEARANLPTWNPSCPSSRAIGAPELIAYLQGQRTLDEARDSAIIATRQYAKRQRTWFRNRMKDWTEVKLHTN